jgi:hypothetical protein
LSALTTAFRHVEELIRWLLVVILGHLVGRGVARVLPWLAKQLPDWTMTAVSILAPRASRATLRREWLAALDMARIEGEGSVRLVWVCLCAAAGMRWARRPRWRTAVGAARGFTTAIAELMLRRPEPPRHSRVMNISATVSATSDLTALVGRRNPVAHGATHASDIGAAALQSIIRNSRMLSLGAAAQVSSAAAAQNLVRNAAMWDRSVAALQGVAATAAQNIIRGSGVSDIGAAAAQNIIRSSGVLDLNTAAANNVIRGIYANKVSAPVIAGFHSDVMERLASGDYPAVDARRLG